MVAVSRAASTHRDGAPDAGATPVSRPARSTVDDGRIERRPAGSLVRSHDQEAQTVERARREDWLVAQRGDRRNRVGRNHDPLCLLLDVTVQAVLHAAALGADPRRPVVDGAHAAARRDGGDAGRGARPGHRDPCDDVVARVHAGGDDGGFRGQGAQQQHTRRQPQASEALRDEHARATGVVVHHGPNDGLAVPPCDQATGHDQRHEWSYRTRSRLGTPPGSGCRVHLERRRSAPGVLEARQRVRQGNDDHGADDDVQRRAERRRDGEQGADEGCVRRVRPRRRAMRESPPAVWPMIVESSMV